MVASRKSLSVLLLFAFLSASAFGYNMYYLPQAAVGVGGDLQFITQISIGNGSADPTEVAVVFVTNDGKPWAVNTSCLENSDLNGSREELGFLLFAKRKYAISMTSAGDFQVGWALVLSPRPIQVSATYGFYRRAAGTTGKIPTEPLREAAVLQLWEPLWEAAVLPAPPAMEFSFPAHSRQGDMIYGADVNTGFAVGNPNEAPVTVTASIWSDAGLLLATEDFGLPAYGHRAQFINELFGGTDLSSVRGVVELKATGPIAVMAMRESKRLDKVVYSTIAVVPASDRGTGLEFDTEPNNSPDDTWQIRPPTQVYGTICDDDNGSGINTDFYRVYLMDRPRIEVILLAGSLGSPLNPTLTLEKENGEVVASSEEIFPGSRDRKLTYTASGEEQLFIRIGAAMGSDSHQAFYRMFVRAF